MPASNDRIPSLNGQIQLNEDHFGEEGENGSEMMEVQFNNGNSVEVVIDDIDANVVVEQPNAVEEPNIAEEPNATEEPCVVDENHQAYLGETSQHPENAFGSSSGFTPINLDAIQFALATQNDSIRHTAAAVAPSQQNMVNLASLSVDELIVAQLAHQHHIGVLLSEAQKSS